MWLIWLMRTSILRRRNLLLDLEMHLMLWLFHFFLGQCSLMLLILLYSRQEDLTVLVNTLFPLQGLWLNTLLRVLLTNWESLRDRNSTWINEVLLFESFLLTRLFFLLNLQTVHFHLRSSLNRPFTVSSLCDNNLLVRAWLIIASLAFLVKM
jgi:hypothetical protein